MRKYPKKTKVLLFFLVSIEQNLYDYASDEIMMRKYSQLTGTPDCERILCARREC